MEIIKDLARISLRMKKSLLLLSCVVGFSWVSARAEDKPETALGKQMEGMNDAFKSLKKETDPVKGAEFARVAQESVLKSVQEIPELIKEMPDGPDKVKAALTFRKMMGQLLVIYCEIEEAFLNGKAADVPKMLDALKELKKSGHDQFMKEE
jgi:Cytochrome b562